MHLFVIFGKHAEKSPVAKALRKLGVELEVYSDAVRLNYPQKYLRYLLGWPRLIMYSLGAAYWSLRQTAQPDVIVVHSHFDILFLWLLQGLRKGSSPKIIWPGFIYTEKDSGIIQNLKHSYYNWILNHTDFVLCHSHHEVITNEKTFSNTKTRFRYYPCAVHVLDATGFQEDTCISQTILSAGRSSRDYSLLFRAVDDQGFPVRVITDLLDIPEGTIIPSNVLIIRNCYGECYLRELKSCRFVVLPLSVKNISAGQMVMLQAMAMGKPTIITRTETTTDYVSDGEGVLFVELGDEEGLREAITRLIGDDELCRQLGRRAAAIYTEKYSIDAYAAHLVDASRLVSKSGI